jgi:hypothetical protein
MITTIQLVTLFRGCCTNAESAQLVILSAAKNLVIPDQRQTLRSAQGDKKEICATGFL